MSKKRVVVVSAACVLAMATMVGGALAYLTDTDTATNTFTIGEVRIDNRIIRGMDRTKYQIWWL